MAPGGGSNRVWSSNFCNKRVTGSFLRLKRIYKESKLMGLKYAKTLVEMYVNIEIEDARETNHQNNFYWETHHYICTNIFNCFNKQIRNTFTIIHGAAWIGWTYWFIIRCRHIFTNGRLLISDHPSEQIDNSFLFHESLTGCNFLLVAFSWAKRIVLNLL